MLKSDTLSIKYKCQLGSGRAKLQLRAEGSCRTTSRHANSSHLPALLPTGTPAKPDNEGRARHSPRGSCSSLKPRVAAMTYQEPAGRERRGELFIVAPAEVHGGALQVQNPVLAHLKTSKPGSEDGENPAPAWQDICGGWQHRPRPLPAPHLCRAANTSWHSLASSSPMLPRCRCLRSRAPHFGIRQLHSQPRAGTNFRREKFFCPRAGDHHAPGGTALATERPQAA